MLKTYALLAIGGGLGAIARYSLSIGVNGWLGSHLPYGTLSVNVLGSLLMGLLLALTQAESPWFPAWLRLVAATGFLGAFTTFSTFELETFELLKTGQTERALLYIALSLAVGLLALWGGYSLARMGLGVLRLGA